MSTMPVDCAEIRGGSGEFGLCANTTPARDSGYGRAGKGGMRMLKSIGQPNLFGV